MNYIDWMKEKVEQMHRVLKPTGSIYLHCDYHASHYLKVYVMDKIFGENKFVNEIIWNYSQGGKSKDRFAHKHDTIFFYAKGKDWTFNGKDVSVPFTPHKGSLTGSFGGRMGKDKDGRPYVEKWGTGKKKLYRYYLDEGKIPEDVWQIQSIQAGATERLGYPTQKPEELLNRIITASSNEGDIVLDPMVGGGTTCAVAQKLKRKWIGIDVSPVACKMSFNRLRKLGASVRVVKGTLTESELHKFDPFQFQQWVCDKLGGRISERKSSDMGIDGYTHLEMTPIQVKQSDDIGRNVIDNFETAVRRIRHNKGFVVAFSFGKGAYEEVKRAKLNDGMDIILITVKELLERKQD